MSKAALILTCLADWIEQANEAGNTSLVDQLQDFAINVVRSLAHGGEDLDVVWDEMQKQPMSVRLPALSA